MNDMRYNRQTSIPQFGEEAQKKLLQSSVAIVGVGGVGSPAALYLVASGIGKIALIDDDIVELHNLQRQILYRETQIGQKKATLAQMDLQNLNSNSTIIKHECRLTHNNAQYILKGYDFVLDGSDNFDARFSINDACVILNTPFISVSVDRFYGQSTLYNYKGSKTYRDLYPDIKSNYPFNAPSKRGVLGVVPGIVAIIAATEIIKILGGLGSVHVGKIIYDALEMEVTKFNV